MANEAIGLLKEVRIETRQRKDGTGNFQTLTLKLEDDTIYSGYVKPLMQIPTEGNTVRIRYQANESPNGYKYNSIISFNGVQSDATTTEESKND